MVEQADGGNVEGLLEGASGRDPAAKFPVVVLGSKADVAGGNINQHAAGRDVAVGEGLQIEEWLEGRAGTAEGVGALVLAAVTIIKIVLGTQISEDLAGLVSEDNDGEIVDFVSFQPFFIIINNRLYFFLESKVKSGLRVAADAAQAEQFSQMGSAERKRMAGGTNGSGETLLILAAVEEALGPHTAKNFALFLFHPGVVAERIQADRVLGDGGEVGGLGNGKIVRRLIEINASGGFNALDVTAKRKAVDVSLEDTALGPAKIKREGAEALDEFIVKSAGRGIDHAGKLHGNCGSAGLDLSGLEIGECGADDGLGVDAVMRIKPLVLGSDKGRKHVAVDSVKFDGDQKLVVFV